MNDGVLHVLTVHDESHGYYFDDRDPCYTEIKLDLREPEDAPSIILSFEAVDGSGGDTYTLTAAEAAQLVYGIESALAAHEIAWDPALTAEQRARGVAAICAASQAAQMGDQAGVARALLGMGDVIVHSLDQSA